MRRIAIKLVLFLLLGAIVNVAVAWGFAAWSAPGNVESLEITSRKIAEDEFEGVTRLRVFGHTRVNHGVFSQPIGGKTAAQLTGIEWIVPGDNYSETRAGWPLRTLRCRNLAEIEMGGTNSITINANTANPIEGGIVLSQFPIGSPAQSWRALPYQPIWTGVVVNTILYAPLVWLLTLGPFAARRIIRRKRGRCAKCGYDLRGAEHDGCPECGGAVKRGSKRG